MKQTPIHSGFNRDLLAMMPAGLGRVVEVGCSSGALARAYREDNPDCHYVGIEIDPEYADVASEHCQQVITGNIESFDDQTLSGLGPVDCWIFGDVLEHLYDPWRMLARVSQTLSAQGIVIACIPNAQHYSFQWRVNTGYLQYADSGLMDRTHIRWFSLRTMRELFVGAGMQITAEEPRIFEDPQAEVVLRAIRTFASIVGQNPEQAARASEPLQWVIKAKKA